MIRILFQLSLLFFPCVFLSCQNNEDSLQGKDTRIYRYSGYMTVDHYSRYYVLNLPPDYYVSNEVPLVIALHGAGGSALQCEKDYRLTEKANLENFAIVYPEGVRNDHGWGVRTWNAGNCCEFASENNINDVGYISKLIDELISSFHINPKRVYVTGMSNGAMMAYRLACEIPDKIAAIAPVSGTMVTEYPCRPSRAVPVLHIHSKLDKNVPVSGGYGIAGYYYPSVDSVLNVWVLSDSCDSTEPQITNSNGYTLFQWKNSRNQVEIDYYLTDDGGHAWPGGIKSRERADIPSTAINANEIIWALFKLYELEQ